MIFLVMKKALLPGAYYAFVGEGHVNTDWLQKGLKNKLICRTGYESQICYYSALQHLYLHCKFTVIITDLELIKLNFTEPDFRVLSFLSTVNVRYLFDYPLASIS